MFFKHVLVVGDHAHVEFREAIAWLGSRCHVAQDFSVDSACARLRTSDPPLDLIVLAQARPGRFAQGDIELLHRTAPLTRLVTLLGSWCEGETCSGHPWVGVVRIYWHEFVPRMERRLERQGQPDRLWSLPRTATGVERLITGCQPIAWSQSGLVAISAASAVVYEGIAEAIVHGGYAAAWVASGRPSRVKGAAAGIWDDSSASAARPLDLESFIDRVRPAPVIALIGFPRGDEDQHARAAGAHAVLAKPFSVDDLLTHLEQAAGLKRAVHGLQTHVGRNEVA